MTKENKAKFYRKIRISLGLMGILPFMIAVWIFYREGLSLSTTVIVFSALILFLILLGFIILRQSADQLATLVKETSAANKDTSIHPVQANIDGELKDIAVNFNTLLSRLNDAHNDIKEQSIQLLKYADDLNISHKKLKKEEKLRIQLSQYIGNDLVNRIINTEGELIHKNQRRTITVMFADIRSFTSISEKMAPEDVVTMLNEYFSVIVEIVFINNGMLDKFVGDQIMAVFGHISEEKEGVNDALKTAIAIQQATDSLMHKRKKQGLIIFTVGIGINTGPAIIAHVGSENRMDYTVIGDTVNMAAKMEKLACPREIIIGQKTFQNKPETIQTDKQIKLKLKNRKEPVICYRLSQGISNKKSQ